MKHTKGPWQVTEPKGNSTFGYETKFGKTISAKDRFDFAFVYTIGCDEEDESDAAPLEELECNAALISAAPELLIALEECLIDVIDRANKIGLDPEKYSTVIKTRAAIAKAKNIQL